MVRINTLTSPKGRAARPSAVLDAEDVQRNSSRGGLDDAIMTDDAVLLPAENHLACNQHERPARCVNQRKPVHFRAVAEPLPIDRVCASISPEFSDRDFSRAQALVERHEVGTCKRFIRYYRKQGEILVCRGLR